MRATGSASTNAAALHTGKDSLMTKLLVAVLATAMAAPAAMASIPQAHSTPVAVTTVQPATIMEARRGRGADDPAGHIRGGKGADDPAGHIRGGKGADDKPNHG